jgi:hypothetical protein
MSMIDVSILRAFITPTEQKDNLITANSKIKTVSGSVIYPYRPDFPAFRPPIAEIAHTGTFNPCPDTGFSPVILQTLKPFCENFGLPNLIHNTNVDYYLQIVKKCLAPFFV